MAKEKNPGESFLKAMIKPAWAKKERESHEQAQRILELLQLQLPDQTSWRTQRRATETTGDRQGTDDECPNASTR